MGIPAPGTPEVINGAGGATTASAATAAAAPRDDGGGILIAVILHGEMLEHRSFSAAVRWLLRRSPYL